MEITKVEAHGDYRILTPDVEWRLHLGAQDPRCQRAIGTWLNAGEFAVGVATSWEAAARAKEGWHLAWVERDGAIDGVSVVTPCRTWFIEPATQGAADMLVAAALRVSPRTLTTSARGKELCRGLLQQRTTIVRERHSLAMVCVGIASGADGRWAEAGDLSALADLLRQSNEETGADVRIDWGKAVDRKQVAVVSRRGRIFGAMLRGGQNQHYAAIRWSYTAPEAKKNNAHGRLMAFVVEELRREGRATHVLVPVEDTVTVDAYHEVGFDTVGVAYTAYLGEVTPRFAAHGL